MKDRYSKNIGDERCREGATGRQAIGCRREFGEKSAVWLHVRYRYGTF